MPTPALELAACDKEDRQALGYAAYDRHMYTVHLLMACADVDAAAAERPEQTPLALVKAM
jgi:hypothetical protein